MPTIFMVIGVGPNDLEIPLIPFFTQGQAEEFINQFPKSDKYKGWLADEFVERDGEYWNEEGEDHTGLYSKLFKNGNYYPGCGGCYMLKVREVEFGLPMVGWDLD